MKKNRSIILAVVALVVVLAIVGIVVAKSNKSTTMDMSNASASSTANAVATDSVALQNYMFSPMAIKVKVGTTVTWTNKDNVNHTVTSTTGNTLNSPLFGLGKTFKYTFTKAGTYSYYCQVHPYMKATVIVTS